MPLHRSVSEPVIFPSLAVSAQGVPKRLGPGRTSYGYERLPGIAPVPRAPRGDRRIRHDACVIRPERSLCMKDILNGALSRPDAAFCERLLARNKMTADEAAKAARRRLRAAANLSGRLSLLRTKSQSGASLASQLGRTADGHASGRAQPAEYTLTLSAVKATAVPNADPQAGGTDPYVSFTVIAQGGGSTKASARTQALTNTCSPAWPDVVSLPVRLDDGGVLVRIAVYDQDVTNDDDLLGEAEVRLSADERAGKSTARMVDTTGAGFAPFKLHFSWTLTACVVAEVTAAPMTLLSLG
jgi:hypothetical protein